MIEAARHWLNLINLFFIEAYPINIRWQFLGMREVALIHFKKEERFFAHL